MAKATVKSKGAKTAEAAAPEKKGGKAPKSPAKATDKAKAGGKAAAEDKDAPKRKLGLRGAAPWAARHAAKHAAEARARAAEPPPPGSARATIRTPSGVEEIKAQIIELHNATEQMKTLRKNVAKNFFEVGLLLRDIQTRKLFGAKGYQSFESFLERESDIGKAVALRLAKLVSVFQRDAAIEFGLDKVMEAMIVLEASAEPTKTVPGPPAPPASRQSANVNRSPIVGRLRPGFFGFARLDRATARGLGWVSLFSDSRRGFRHHTMTR